MPIILVIGGARSGKSTYAENLCKNYGGSVCYLATAKAIDDDMVRRINKHKLQRPSHWSTIEKHRDFDLLSEEKSFMNCDTFLLDCVTIMITNIMFDEEIDYDTCNNETIEIVEKSVNNEMKKLINIMKNHKKTLVLVANEVGMGLVPSYRLGNIFRDIAGRTNQYLAQEADEVYNVICGLPQKLK